MVSEADYDKNQTAFLQAQQQQQSGTLFQDLTGINVGQGLLNETPEQRSSAFNEAASLVNVGVGQKAARAVKAAPAARTAIAAAAREAYAAAIKGGAGKAEAAAAARIAAAKAGADASFMAGNYLTWAGKKIASLGLKKAVGGTVGIVVSYYLLDVIRGALTDKNAGAMTLQGWYVDGVMNEDEYKTEIGKLDLGEQEKYYVEAAQVAREEKIMKDMEHDYQIEIVPPEFRTIQGETPEARSNAYIQEQARLAQTANAQGMTVAQVEQANQQFNQAVKTGEIQRQQRESGQKVMTNDQLAQMPPGQLEPSDMEKLLKSQLPNEPVAPTAPPPIQSKQPVQNVQSSFSPLYKTKDAAQNALGMSMTDAAWQQYLKTGRLPGR